MKISPSRWAAVFLLAMGVAAAQPAGRALGVVETVDPNGQIILHSDAGATVKIVPQSGARVVRIPPGETSLQKAVPITAAEIQSGDRLLAVGALSGDTLAARLLVVMTKADLARKHEADRAEWRKRGVGGLVEAVDPGAGQVTIRAHTAEGLQPLVIVTSPKTVVRRYAPDSVKFADAQPSTLAEIKPGDQVRALGEKSADGLRFLAEEIVSGSFRNIAATINSVDPAANTLLVTDLATKKPLLVHVSADSKLRKLPPFVAQMIAMRNRGGGPPAGAAQHAAAPGPGGAEQAAGRPRDLQQMLDRMPPLKLADLKPGDAIIVASTEGKDPAHVTAITLLAGVEPILSAAPGGRERSAMLGNWNLDMNMGGVEQ
jgi:hypothetical protein